MKITGDEIVRAIASADDITALTLSWETIADRLRAMTKMATDHEATYSPNVKKLRATLVAIEDVLDNMEEASRSKGGAPTATPMRTRIGYALSREYALEIKRS